MTEKRQTSQGYIIRILQHFATKLWNITNFVMLFQAFDEILSRLVYIKISLKRGKVYWKRVLGLENNRLYCLFHSYPNDLVFMWLIIPSCFVYNMVKDKIKARTIIVICWYHHAHGYTLTFIWAKVKWTVIKSINFYCILHI
jgi:hypothetical protein